MLHARYKFSFSLCFVPLFHVLLVDQFQITPPPPPRRRRRRRPEQRRLNAAAADPTVLTTRSRPPPTPRPRPPRTAGRSTSPHTPGARPECITPPRAMPPAPRFPLPLQPPPPRARGCRSPLPHRRRRRLAVTTRGAVGPCRCGERRACVRTSQKPTEVRLPAGEEIGSRLE